MPITPDAGADFGDKVLFNNGEGLDEADLNRINAEWMKEMYTRGALDISELNAVLNMGYNTGQGASLMSTAVYNIASTILMTMSPKALPIANGSVRTDLNILSRTHTIAKARGAGVGGPYFTNEGQLNILTLDEDQVNFTLGAAPATNPRWDTVFLDLDTENRDSVARDFKDASTLALSSSAQNKTRGRLLSGQVVAGTEAATPDFPSGATGEVPWVSVKRTVGESTPLPKQMFAYHAYPPRLAVEDVLGQDMIRIGSGLWSTDTLGFGSSEHSGGVGTADLIAVPKRMNAGCRLIGVGIHTDMAASPQDHAVQVGQFQYQLASGPTFTSLVDIGSGSPMGLSQDGFQFASERDWSVSTGIRLPIWGNGGHYGPIFNEEAHDFTSTASLFEKLAVKVSNGPSSTTWNAGDRVCLVRFIYLY